MKTIHGRNGKDLIIDRVLPPILKDDDDCEERVLVLTGRRRKADLLSWSGMYGTEICGEFAVNCQGLYRGSYGDAVLNASDLYKFLYESAPRLAFRFLSTWKIWVEDAE